MAMDRLAVATAAGDHHGQVNAEAHVARVVGETQALSALIGAMRLCRQVRETERPQLRATRALGFNDSYFGLAVFTQAVDAILRREPILARFAEDLVSALTRGAFFASRAATLHQTKRVQTMIGEALREGRDRRSVVQAIQAETEWSRGYAETVYRTNAISAYSSGVREMAQQPELGGAVAALQFSATLDRDVRPNHRAAHGFVAQPNDPAWDRLTPPLGFNCRCSIRPVMRQEARRMFGSDTLPLNVPLPQGAGPDPGFTPQPFRR